MLQQTLLELWLGPRDELCVVGDDYQSIYAFTGASPEHLLSMPTRFPHATVIRLEENYRSSPQVLALANRLVPKLGGAEKTLRATRADGPEPELHACRTRPRSRSSGFARSTSRTRTSRSSAARTRGSSTSRRRCTRRGIPAQGASFLGRESARYVLRRLASPARRAQARARSAAGSRDPPDKLGEREVVRQTDLGRLVKLADELAELDGPGFVAELERRFGDGGEARRGVHLLTIHGAKGLEFEAVFVARVGGEGAADAPGEVGRRDRGGAAALLRRPDASEAASVRDVDADAVALPARARAPARGRRRRAASRSRTIRSSPRSRPGGSSAPAPTRSRRTSSSTTRRSPRSRAASRGR